jgi:hypothetical protein
VIPDNTSEVMFEVTGDAFLIGLNPIKAEAEIASILLKVGDKPGMLKISAKTEGIRDAIIELTIK